eukprot:m.126976 g.126976  ORF g.126976 m.126976 type:complete len:399 (-) comp17401_c0_seq1:160-1356(-)
MARSFAILVTVALTNLATAQVPCPNGHSDCSVLESASYCANYSATGRHECWPCIMCSFFQDSITGNCDICGPGGLPDPTATASPDYVDVGESDDETTTVVPDTTVATTVAVTRAPTSSPFSTTAGASCPRECGTVADGGGTCSSTTGLCASCNSNRILVHGGCIGQIYCRGRRIQGGRFIDETCRCSDSNCHYCHVTSAGETCRQCRNGFYLRNEQCIATCPANETSSGVSLFGRLCVPPFICKSNRAQGVSPSRKCRCPNADNTAVSDCHQCNFTAGGFGASCLSCRNGKYLHNEECHDDCSVRPGSTLYEPSTYGRECRDPFTCDNRRDENGRLCKCSRAIGAKTCATCMWTLTGNTCTMCTSGRYLHNGACISNCPAGFVNTGTGRTGRSCTATP